MKEEQAEKICKLSIKNCKKAKELFRVVKEELKIEENGGILSDEFEFSFIDGEKERIRLLHLLFWKEDIGRKNKKDILRLREEGIIAAAKKIGNMFKASYDFGLLQSLFGFNRQKGMLFPIQFGLDYGENKPPRVKVYLSINGNSFPFRDFCDLFGLKSGNFKGIGSKKLDTVAIDSFADGKFFFKFYPMKGKGGWLFRVDQESRVVSRKKWLKLSGLKVGDALDSFPVRMPEKLEKFIRAADLRVHYICDENSVKSFYIR